jgi:hypothetical protein
VQSRRSYLNISFDKLWQEVLYCNFIVKAIVSESAILTFCIDVLSMIGLMTADDLGKRLNEASKVPQLMVTLQEQVGGLKEFLKRYPDIFVFSFEHPYNPHVFLRISLTPELQLEVENGVLPVKFLTHVIAKVYIPFSLPSPFLILGFITIPPNTLMFIIISLFLCALCLSCSSVRPQRNPAAQGRDIPRGASWQPRQQEQQHPPVRAAAAAAYARSPVSHAAAVHGGEGRRVWGAGAGQCWRWPKRFAAHAVRPGVRTLAAQPAAAAASE